MTTPENSILARRKLTNKFIAQHDAPRLKPFFDAAITVIAGDGSVISGISAVLDAFAVQFRDPAFIAYVRTSTQVSLDATASRAAEAGTWTAQWRGHPDMSGTYLACWKKVTGQWVIESELFVTLA